MKIKINLKVKNKEAKFTVTVAPTVSCLIRRYKKDIA